jgi:hypothetical protein
MSDHYLVVVPADPYFVPDETRQQAAWHTITTAVRDATTTIEISDHPVLVDAGGNWEGVRCPRCGTALGDGWWAEQVSESYRTSFADLAVTTPCCEAQTSLNELDYPWQVSFARFRLVVANPTAGVPPGLVEHLSQILDAPVRIILRHI